MSLKWTVPIACLLTSIGCLDASTIDEPSSPRSDAAMVDAAPDVILMPDAEPEPRPDMLDVGEDVPVEDAAEGDVVAEDVIVVDVPDPEPDAMPDPEPIDPHEVLRLDGQFLEVSGEGEDPEWVRRFGEMGTQYQRIEISFEVFVARWRDGLFERDILSHNAFGLSRVAPRSHQRYLLGLGAQIKASQMPGLRRRALFYARVDLEERPPGEGYTAYTSFRRDFAWELGTTYQIHAVLNVEEQRQVLTISQDGQELARIAGDIAYITPSLTTSGFSLDFGGEESTHRDVKTVGWRYSNLRVRAIPLQ